MEHLFYTAHLHTCTPAHLHTTFSSGTSEGGGEAIKRLGQREDKSERMEERDNEDGVEEGRKLR